MSSLHEQIYETWNLRETEDLLVVWQTNDRVEWSEDVFEVVEEILIKRGVEIPQQDPPVLVHESKDEKTQKILSEQESKIVRYKNQPEFYNPLRVFKVCKRLNTAAKIMIVLVVIMNLVYLQNFIGLARSYSPLLSYPLLVLVGCILMGVNMAIDALIYYFPLVTLSHVLRILMEMDFNSRKVL